VRGDWAELGGDRWPAIVAPGESRVGYWLAVPHDAELRLRYARSGEGGPLAVTVADAEAWRAVADPGRWEAATLDLRPWAGQTVALSLLAEGDGQVLWGDPQIVSERGWLLEYPLADQPEYGQVARFGDQIELLGYDLETSRVRPGSTVRVVLYGRALRPMDTAYTVFVHLLGPAGVMRGQTDRQPLKGTYPTSVWPLDAVVRDEYVVPVAGDAPPGAYRIAVGLYELATLERLPATSATGEPVPDGRLTLGAPLEVGE
jgi:hypothetical protein